MKNIKLLTGLVGLTTLVSSVVPTITSCSSKTTGHIKLNDTQKSKVASNGIAYYYVTLDSDQYKSDEFSINLLSRSNADLNDLFATYTVNGSLLCVKVKTNKSYAQQTTYNFDLEVKCNSWTQKLEDFKFIVPADIFDGQVTPAQWAAAIDLLVSDNENFTAKGESKYVDAERPSESYTYNFNNKYDKNQTEQTVTNHPKLGELTYYMDTKYDVYWTYYKDGDNWIADYPYIEKFGFDDFYYFLYMLKDLRDMETSGMEFVSSEVGGIGYYYGTTTYKTWSIEFGFKFNADKVIEKTEIKATNGQKTRDVVATYSNYTTTSFTVPQEMYNATYKSFKELVWDTTKTKYTGYISDMQQDAYYVLPLKYTDDMPETLTIDGLKGIIPVKEKIPLDIIGAYAFVNGTMQEATIDKTTKVCTFANPITINKADKDTTTITFVLWFDAYRKGADIELIPHA